MSVENYETQINSNVDIVVINHDFFVENNTTEQQVVSCDEVNDSIHMSVENCETSVNSDVHVPIKKRKINKKDKFVNVLKIKEFKIEKAKLKHPLRSISCKETCKNKCKNILLPDQRQKIWQDFWLMDYISRRKYLAKYIKIKPVKRRSTKKDHPIEFKRNESRYYYLPGSHENIKVCKSTFLNTFGYSNDSILTALCKHMKVGDDPYQSDLTENRGRIVDNSTINDSKVIIDHNNMDSSGINHCYRPNTAKGKNKPNDLSVKTIYEDFCSTHIKMSNENQTSAKSDIDIVEINNDFCEKNYETEQPFLEIPMVSDDEVNDHINISIENYETLIKSDVHNPKKKQKKSKTDKFGVCLNNKEIKIEKAKLKHPLRNITCKETCKNKCKDFLLPDQRQKIWQDFWLMDYISRRRYLAKYIKIKPVKHRSKKTDSPINFKRNESRYYYLPGSHENETIKVCKSTFLNTFGYSNDSVLTALCKHIAVDNDNSCQSKLFENRGNPFNICKIITTIDREVIINHIKMYNPCTSHYTSNIKFLPRELTVKKMYEDFCSRHGKYFSRELYRSVLKDLNISLKNSTSDKCEDCSTYSNQIKKLSVELTPRVDEIELLTLKFDQHKLKANLANLIYKQDASIDINTTKVYSMDLQQVLLLPVIPESKTSYFTSRLVVFNETFASLKPKDQSHCVLWHEAIAGRKAENITDSILALIKEERDTKDFIFWADNCVKQNKNWVLFTALVCTLNSKFNNAIESITIKYLTKGHVHMTTEEVHGSIEKKIKQVRSIYDYDDLKNTIKVSRTKLNVIDQNQFFYWSSKKQSTDMKSDSFKDFKLSNVVMVKFLKGSTKMLYLTDFKQDVPKELEFMPKQFLRNIYCYEPYRIKQPRGIPNEKKEEIVNKLVPLMPHNRKKFWTSLPVCKTSKDLIHETGLSNTFISECE